MKIIMICGSPRIKNSTSAFLLQEVKKKLGDGNNVRMYYTGDGNSAAEQIAEADSIILSFPLYVDGIPAGMLEWMCDTEAQLKERRTGCRVSMMINNGFYEAVQNRIAIDMVWKWCERCGMRKGNAIGVGAGEMVRMAPLGYGPNRNLGRALSRFASDILSESSGETVFVEPNFPRFLYKLAAHMGWRSQAAKNGLKAADISRKI